ncbi:hypothetical protein VCHA53O466_50112 [Vibrio chagasii]|nr:hypothetical protein VCHA53O466_50112 [Vibrio chagasii]
MYINVNIFNSVEEFLASRDQVADWVAKEFGATNIKQGVIDEKFARLLGAPNFNTALGWVQKNTDMPKDYHWLLKNEPQTLMTKLLQEVNGNPDYLNGLTITIECAEGCESKLQRDSDGSWYKLYDHTVAHTASAKIFNKFGSLDIDDGDVWRDIDSTEQAVEMYFLGAVKYELNEHLLAELFAVD